MKTTKPFIMMLCKFSAFGPTNKRSQLELYHHKDGSPYRARVLVLRVQEYSNANSENCIRVAETDDVICELSNIDSSCIQTVSLLSEDVAHNHSIVPYSQDYLKISDLEVVFRWLQENGKYHDCGKNVVIQPIIVYGETSFHTTTTSARSGEIVVCNICVPPMTISKEKFDGTALQRAIRCHHAVHLLKNRAAITSNEPCGFCLLGCHANVETTRKNLQDIVNNGASVKPATNVMPNCRTFHAAIGTTIQFKSLKAVRDFPCSNKLVYCNTCKDFIWSYNLENHYPIVHDSQVPSNLTHYLLNSEECDKLVSLFPINTRNQGNMALTSNVNANRTSTATFILCPPDTTSTEC